MPILTTLPQIPPRAYGLTGPSECLSLVLRGIHRKVSENPSGWERPTPFHSYLARDAEPMVPGEVVELAVGLQPTSFLFRAGHRIRIAIAGHDGSSFRRVPAEGTPLLRVQRNSTFASHIELPVVPR